MLWLLNKLLLLLRQPIPLILLLLHIFSSYTRIKPNREYCYIAVKARRKKFKIAQKIFLHTSDCRLKELAKRHTALRVGQLSRQRRD